MANGALKLEEDQFWEDPGGNESAVIGRLADEAFLGLVIDAPRRVPLNLRDRAPVVGYFARSLRDDRAINLEAELIGVAVDPGTNAVRTGIVLHTDRRSPPPAAATDDEPPRAGVMISRFGFDARHLLNLPWKPGCHKLQVLLRDQLSEPVQVEFAAGPSKYEDPEVRKFIEELKLRNLPPPHVVAPPLPLASVDAEKRATWPNYDRLPESPPEPEEVGIALSAPRVTLLDEVSSCVVHGTFRLPVLPRERVLRRDTSHDVLAAGATAVVPITLVLTGVGHVGPKVARLHVPSMEYIAADADNPTVTGHFHVELLTLPGICPLKGTTYFLYAFHGAATAGPVPVAFVTPEMLED
jgi:hypothetical protein